MTKQKHSISPYYNTKHINEYSEDGDHRQFIGGLWDEMGQLQFDFLKSNGLLPGHRLLDIGCGCLRGGVYFVDYLENSNYFGTDMNQSLLNAGYHIELKDKSIQEKIPIENLLCDEEFDFSSFETKFDFALAVSVFTHLPLNLIRQCLERLSTVMNNNGVFFATVFECGSNHETWKPLSHQPGNITTYGSKDPYHYFVDDFEHICKYLPWKFEYVGNFGHPRNQMMLKFSYIG